MGIKSFFKKLFGKKEVEQKQGKTNIQELAEKMKAKQMVSKTPSHQSKPIISTYHHMEDEVPDVTMTIAQTAYAYNEEPRIEEPVPEYVSNFKSDDCVTYTEVEPRTYIVDSAPSYSCSDYSSSSSSDYSSSSSSDYSSSSSSSSSFD